MDESWKYTKWKKPVTKDKILYDYYEMFKIGKFIVTGRRLGVIWAWRRESAAGGGGTGGEWRLTASGYGISLEGDKDAQKLW